MNAMPPNFAEETFVNSQKKNNMKFVNVFSLISYPLYTDRRDIYIHTLMMYTTTTLQTESDNTF